MHTRVTKFYEMRLGRALTEEEREAILQTLGETLPRYTVRVEPKPDERQGFFSFDVVVAPAG